MPNQDVCLVNMPFGGIERPSIGLGLLKAILQQHGISSEIIYANLSFAEEVGVVRYSVPDQWTAVEHFAGEWSFAQAAFREEAPDGAYYDHLEQLLRGRLGANDTPEVRGLIVAGVQDLRRFAQPFVDRMAEAILERQPKIVGCTSVFQQHCASLALLRRIRELAPSVVTVLGGPNCESEMGLATHRNCEWIDYVVSGEADSLVGPLFQSILEHGRDIPLEVLPASVRGPVHRRLARMHLAGAHTLQGFVVRELDALPTPDYDDYFRALHGSTLQRWIHPVLLIESSRGCWWGEKKHCTFCGLNANGMTYRLKSPDRVMSELGYLADRHGINHIEAVDNILSFKYFETLLPALAARATATNWKLFFETKSNLRWPQVQALRQAGITIIQPGIESLHSEVLRLMRKGVHALQNVRLLKWSRELGIRVVWSILRGFPGERDEWYAETAAWLSALEHLDPPSGIFPIRYDRFSPYHADSAAYGLRLEPSPLARFVYPFSATDLADQTYYFIDRNLDDAPAKGLGATAMEHAVARWRGVIAQGGEAVLWYEEHNGSLVFHDTRRCALASIKTCDGLLREVYLCCDDGLSRQQLLQTLNSRGFVEAPEAVDAALASLMKSRLLLELDGQFLSLANKGKPPDCAALEDSPLGYIDPDYYRQELNTLVGHGSVR